ncbi:MAG: hypothetical protein Q4P34_07075 [Tissierellia bacterium]|nr:hypothetical protein [Tissierellia bacterium]
MILLSKNDAFRWHEKLDCYLKGYFYQTDLNHEKIIDELLKIEDQDGFAKYLKSLNGEFSMLRETDDFIIAAVDFTRSFPIFYTTGDSPIVSDTPEGILRIVKEPQVDELAVREIRISGTTFGNRTLFKDIKTLGCGEMLFFDKQKGELRIREYMDFDREPFSQDSVSELLDEMNQIYSNAVKKSLLPLKDRTVVVPLTSEWWPRILVDKIKELGLKNVICYSYGGRNNPDCQKAREIAEYYGYPWYYVEYEAFEWFKWFTGKDYQRYKKYSSQYVSVPNISEYLAVKSLTEKRIVPEDSVFINVCFTGVLRGDLLPKIFLDDKNIKDDVLAYEIMREIGSNIKWNRKDSMLLDDYLEDIFSRHLNTAEFDAKSPLWKFKYSYWKERVGKHLSNSRRVYEIYGYVWRNIQLDKEIVDFWSKVPNDIRYMSMLQKEYDAKFNPELTERLGLNRDLKKNSVKLNAGDKFRLRFPKLYRKLVFSRKSKSLVNAYDHDPMLWYNIISRREFTRFRESIANIIGVESIKYLRDFCKEYECHL